MEQNLLQNISIHFNTQHFYPTKITTIWNALPSEVVSSRTVNSFKNSLDKHWAENAPNARVNWQQSSMPYTIQVCTTVVGQCFAGNGPNGLCAYYCDYCDYYYYYYNIIWLPRNDLHIQYYYQGDHSIKNGTMATSSSLLRCAAHTCGDKCYLIKVYIHVTTNATSLRCAIHTCDNKRYVVKVC